MHFYPPIGGLVLLFLTVLKFVVIFYCKINYSLYICHQKLGHYQIFVFHISKVLLHTLLFC